MKDGGRPTAWSAESGKVGQRKSVTEDGRRRRRGAGCMECSTPQEVPPNNLEVPMRNIRQTGSASKKASN